MQLRVAQSTASGVAAAVTTANDITGCIRLELPGRKADASGLCHPGLHSLSLGRAVAPEPEAGCTT